MGANAGRLNVDFAGGAWCPRALIDAEATEFIEVDLGAVHAVTAVLTQGRFGNGHGQEFAEAFFVEYTRPGEFLPRVLLRDDRSSRSSQRFSRSSRSKRGYKCLPTRPSASGRRSSVAFFLFADGANET